MFEFTETHRQQIHNQLTTRQSDELKNEHMFALLDGVFTLVGVGNEQFVDAGIVAGAEAYLHTHPVRSYEPVIPSLFDMQVFNGSDKPQGIMNYCCYEDEILPVFWHDDIVPTVESLEGRLYRWGDYGSDGKGDCFAIIKDWFLLNKGFVIPSVPRDFYDKEKIYYTLGHIGLANIKQFERLNALSIGDVLVFKIGKQGEHSGIYIGNGQMLHHPSNGVSKVETVSRYVPFIHMVLEVII
jgi:hypothetical protein